MQNWVLTIDWLEQGSEEIELSLEIPRRGDKGYVSGRGGRYIHGCTLRDRGERSGIKWGYRVGCRHISPQPRNYVHSLTVRVLWSRRN